MNRNIFKRMRIFYKNISVFLFTVFMIFLAINVAAFITLFIIKKSKNESSFPKNIYTQSFIATHGEIKIDSGYISEVYKDFKSNYENETHGYRYHPVIEYTSSLVKSKHLNVIREKFDIPRRITLPYKINPRDSLITIYCFGGSSTFGWLVSDEHTWPSLLMKRFMEQYPDKKIVTVNYGSVGYSPSQETDLFIQLLKLGHKPSLCIFMDGVNTGPVWDCSELSRQISASYRNSNPGLLNVFLSRLPATQLIFSLIQNQGGYSDDSLIFPLEYSSGYNQMIINRFENNAKIRKSISKLYRVPIIQFLQPAIWTTGANYRYRKLIPKDFKDSPRYINDNSNYTILYSRLGNPETGYIDLTNAIYSYPDLPFIDWCHYSPNFNLHLADTLLTFININLMKYQGQPSFATGISYDN